jgi:hypothetical protein
MYSSADDRANKHIHVNANKHPTPQNLRADTDVAREGGEDQRAQPSIDRRKNHANKKGAGQHCYARRFDKMEGPNLGFPITPRASGDNSMLS